MAVAAYAVSAAHAFIGLKETFAIKLARLRGALEEMRAADTLGAVPIEVVYGPDHYLLGEETGLLEVIEGRASFASHPSAIRPGTVRQLCRGRLHTRQQRGDPSQCVDILREGPDWLLRVGTARSPGNHGVHPGW